MTLSLYPHHYTPFANFANGHNTIAHVFASQFCHVKHEDPLKRTRALALNK